MPDGDIDARAVRVGVAASARLEGDPAITVAPPPDASQRVPQDGDPGPVLPLVDGVATAVRLERFGEVRARLVESAAGLAGPDVRTDLQLGPVRVDPGHGTRLREVVVDGWRIEVEVEFERRAVLRARARRGAGVASHGGPVEVRAIIPGRVVAVSVVVGDSVEAGQQILVVEAMKMQNELRAPREGAVERVGVAVGDTIEVGDLLVVIH
ncbi:MAG TPA: biotin/lipoyl-containing protein [Candidatus Limnocylindrales bacterium]